MCRLSIVIGVQCEKNQDIIERIQMLSEPEQHSLMKAIEEVSGGLACEGRKCDDVVGYGQSESIGGLKCRRVQYDRVCTLRLGHNSPMLKSLCRDDRYYQIQSARSRILSEKETLEQVYQALLTEHRTLQTNFDDVASEKEEALAQFRQAQKDADNRRVDNRGDSMLRAEIERLRSEL